MSAWLEDSLTIIWVIKLETWDAFKQKLCRQDTSRCRPFLFSIWGVPSALSLKIQRHQLHKNDICWHFLPRASFTVSPINKKDSHVFLMSFASQCHHSLQLTAIKAIHTTVQQLDQLFSCLWSCLRLFCSSVFKQSGLSSLFFIASQKLHATFSGGV